MADADNAGGTEQATQNNDVQDGAGDAQGTEGASPSVEELKKQMEAMQERLKLAETEAITRKKKLREVEEASKKAEEQKLQEQNKWKELAESRERDLQSMQESLRNQAIQTALSSEASKAGLRDMALLKLVDRSAVLVDPENNSVHGVAEAVAGLKKTHPYLFENAKVPQTVKGNEGPKFSEKGEISQEDLAKMPHDKIVEYYKRKNQKG